MNSNFFISSKKKAMLLRTYLLGTSQVTVLKDISRQLGISQSEVVRRSIDYFRYDYEKFKEKVVQEK